MPRLVTRIGRGIGKMFGVVTVIGTVIAENKDYIPERYLPTAHAIIVLGAIVAHLTNPGPSNASKDL